MKIEVSDATALPEWLQSHVSEGHLDLAAVPAPEDVTGLKTALVKERENAAAYSKFGKPDEIAAKIADLEEKAKGTGKGAEDAQAKLDAMKGDYEAKLSERDQRFQKLMTQRAQSDLKAELAKAGVVPEGLDMLATFAAQRIQFHDDGTPKVLSADGKPMIGSGADHGATLSDLAKELAGSMPYLVKDAGTGGSGKQPGSSGGKPQAKTMTRAAFDALDAGAKQSAMRDGTTLTD
tara:strand:+ start:2645 stop:3349 length:705 start_codon:yes stop_codon:yes gene_type:complete